MIELGTTNTSGQSGCNIKNRNCVPKCSELTQEEMLQGLQCEMGMLPYQNIDKI